MAELIKIENPQSIEVHVSGPDGANRLFVYTGTAVFLLEGPEYGWKADILKFVPLEMPGGSKRVFTRRQIHKAVATASLSAIYNPGNTASAGWAIDQVDADWDDETGHVWIETKLAVNGEKAAMVRISYQVMVLAQLEA